MSEKSSLNPSCPQSQAFICQTKNIPSGNLLLPEAGGGRRGLAAPCHFLTTPPYCSWARSTETGQQQQGGLCHSWARASPLTFLLQAGFLPPLSRPQTTAHQPDTQPRPSPLGLRLRCDSCQVKAIKCQVYFLCSLRGGWAGTYLSARLAYRYRDVELEGKGGEKTQKTKQALAP